MKKGIPLASTPKRPLPLSIAATATEEQYIYSLSGPLDLAHLDARPSMLGLGDGLLAATASALVTITANREQALLRGYQSYRKALALIQMDCPPTSEPDLLEVEIRTESQDLITAATYLRTLYEDEVPAGLIRDVVEQLRRFQIRWTLLPAGAPELQALKRWAQVHCQPGRAAFIDGPERPFRRSRDTDQDFDGAQIEENTHDEDEPLDLAA